MLHYTWGAEFHEGSSKGKMVWQFDKRLWSGGLPHHRLPMPPRSPAHEKGETPPNQLYLQVRDRPGRGDAIAPDVRPAADAADARSPGTVLVPGGAVHDQGGR